MKKILLTASLLIASMSATFAQMPDASKWKVGEEITESVGLGNPSFENPTKDPWQFVMSKGETTETGGLFECYNGADEDLYQFVQLPVGQYRLECQGYYRNGTSWADDPNTFGTSDWQDNALLYASNGTYNIDGTFDPSHTFTTPLMPRLFPNQREQLYVMPPQDDPNHWDMSDGQYNQCGGCWGPCSVDGSLVWFNAGLYEPFVDEDEDIKYNTVTFYVFEAGYIKLGVQKKEIREADSFMATNFKLYYEGEVDPEAVELAIAQEEVANYYNKLVDLRDTYEGGLIYTLIDDAIYEFDDTYGSVDELETKAQCEEALATLKPLYEQAVAAQTDLANLQAIVPGMELLYNTTDYAGKAAFGAALQTAQDYLNPDYQAQPDDDFSKYKTACDELIAARIAYLMTQEKVNGAYNFSAALATPFFCDGEFTPVWNDEANAYQFPYIEGVGDDLQPENTWATIQENGYADLINPENENYRADWIHICDNVKIYEKYTENQWVIHSTTWHGGGPVAVTMQHSYPAIGGWTAEPSNNPEYLYQTITNLPNGYYAMSALMCNAGADISPLQYVFISNDWNNDDKAGSPKLTAPLTLKGNPWWGGNREAWRSGVWQKLQTNMVYVSDGKVTIGSASDAFYAVTGFQLYYYGETPDFNGLLNEDIAKAKANIETLTWQGDIAAANAIFAEIPENIDSQETYETALAIIAEVNDYVNKANNVINNWKALDNFSALGDKQEKGSVEETIVEVAMMEVLLLGEGEDDTYLDAIAADEAYEAYADYLAYRAGMANLAAVDDDLKAAIEKQNEYLVANFASAEEINDFKAQLAAPYNKALLASLGIDKATPENPVDVTVLIVNPKFDEGNKGWSGDFTTTSSEAVQEALGAAEVWNTNFNVYQTIYSLPAGQYRVEVQACYRDDAGAANCYNNWWYTAGGDMEFWEHPNAKLYANNEETTIVSLASELFKTRSMTAYINKYVIAEEPDEQGNEYYVPFYRALDSISAEPYQPYVEYDSTSWWWDTKIDDFDENLDEATFYYPASLMGISKRYADNPTAYVNTVSANVREGGSLTIGIKKETLVNGDWVPFDNWKLFYCGKAVVSVEDITNLIDEYLTEGSTVTVEDITNLIDLYLQQ